MMASLWPNLFLVSQVKKKGNIVISPSLPFNKSRTKAIHRIGPQNTDALSRIIHRLLGTNPLFYRSVVSIYGADLSLLKRNYYSTLKPLPPVAIKKRIRLKNHEKNSIILPEGLHDILIGLLLGDVCGQKQSKSAKGNTNLRFEQGLVHKDYIFHLYELFKSFSGAPPRISERKADKRTGKIYTRVQFATFSLPCFNELYNTFYPNGKKVVPYNIEQLLTPLGLAYWICDDGTFCKKHKYIRIATNSYTLQEVDLLLGVLRVKFHLTCYCIEDRTGYVITIAAKSVISLRPILQPLMPSMMLHKLGLPS